MKKLIFLIFLFFSLVLLSFQNNNAINFYQNGLKYEENKDYLKAIEQYIKAIELNPNYFDAYYHLASCYFILEKYEEAMDYYSKGFKTGIRR